jgi:preprotein translocase subunit SecG
MVTLLFAVLIISWILFIVSVLLMTPKWGLWFGVGGMATSNEYGSKKSVEWTLKKTALVSIIAFTIAAILYPFADKKELATGASTKQVKQQSIQIKPEDIKVNAQTASWVKIQVQQPTTGTNK